MSLQESSRAKPFKNFFTSLIEAHPDASMHSIAVLFTDVVGSTKYFKTHGDIRGREMLRKHHTIATSIVEEYGGSLIKEVGDSVMVYFPETGNALKAAIKMQHSFGAYNK
ncbi:MAG TPA: adenylate/guanylate cyclase domain-containing protein, partial [Syntrophorhabdaceae bacterium]|nr:adenylate/guanylate cyclase domain-containing protein [Syntrophorhabdaceae bacterium]